MDQVAQNTAIVKDIYAQWDGSKASDIDAVMDRIDDYVEWRSLANGRAEVAFTKPRKGKNEVLEYLTGLTDDWSMNHFTVHDVIAQNDRVVVLATISWTCKKTGKTMEGEKADVLTLKNGKIVSFMEFYDTAGLIAAAQ